MDMSTYSSGAQRRFFVITLVLHQHTYCPNKQSGISGRLQSHVVVLGPSTAALSCVKPASQLSISINARRTMCPLDFSIDNGLLRHLHRRISRVRMLFEPVQKLENARLGRPLQTCIIHVLQSEPHACAETPLKIVLRSREYCSGQKQE